MRLLSVLTLSVSMLLSLGGCSVFDSAVGSAGQSAANYHPSKIYLGDSTVMIPARQVNDYACIDRPMLCERFGVDMRCRCTY
jgi:hypothetical protein